MTASRSSTRTYRPRPARHRARGRHLRSALDIRYDPDLGGRTLGSGHHRACRLHSSIELRAVARRPVAERALGQAPRTEPKAPAVVEEDAQHVAPTVAEHEEGPAQWLCGVPHSRCYVAACDMWRNRTPLHAIARAAEIRDGNCRPQSSWFARRSISSHCTTSDENEGASSKKSPSPTIPA